MPERDALPPAGEAYLGRLQKLTDHVDPLVETDAAREIRAAAASLEGLAVGSRDDLVDWVQDRPKDVYTLALSVGLSQEKLKNLLKAKFQTSSWAKAARQDAGAVVDWLDDEYDVLDTLAAQVGRSYSLGDVLAARGTSRQTASRAGVAGRLIEDAVEDLVQGLGLAYQMRGRFVGQNGNTGPADLAIPNFADCLIAVGCKGFDSTGSKLTAAVTEVQDMAQVRYAHQFVFAVVDGIGWVSRGGDFRRLFALAESRRINGLYSLADLNSFRDDLVHAAQVHKLV